MTNADWIAVIAQWFGDRFGQTETSLDLAQDNKAAVG
jgi:hypothetical protein